MTKTSHATHPKKILQTLKGAKLNPPPLWLMRQAGRYLPEYLALRATCPNFMEFCYSPKLTTEATLQPLRRFDLDAAILFSDILVVPHALGQAVNFAKDHGPQLGELPELSTFNETVFHVNLSPVYETLSAIKSAMIQEGFESKSLIGFSGAPWTLACYMIEKSGSRDFSGARLYALKNPEQFSNLIEILTTAITSYCIRQIEHGAEIIQLFDSWSGALTPPEFERWVIEPTKKITASIATKYPDIPVIGFPKGAGIMLPRYAEKTGVTALGLDQFVPLPWALENLPESLPLQGNLDPMLLITGGENLDKAITDILSSLRGRPHILNLGHGIDKTTPIAHVERMITTIKDFNYD